MIFSADEFECMISSQGRTILNTENVKLLLEELLAAEKITTEQAEACFKTSTAQMVKTNRKDTTKKPKWVAPTLSPNVTPEQIVDELGVCRETMALLKKTEGFYKDVLMTRFVDPTQVDSQDFNNTVEEEGWSPES